MMQKCHCIVRSPNFLLRVVAGHHRHFIARSQEHRHALVQLVWLDVHDAVLAVGGRATGLLHDEGHRIRLIHQPQLARHRGVARVGRVHEDAAAVQDAVHVGDHRGDPAHVEVGAARAGVAGQQFADVALHRRVPVALIGHVDREFLGGGRDLDVALRQHPRAHLAVQGEAVDAVAGGEHQHGLRAVHGVACGHLLGAGLHEVGFGRLAHAFRSLKYREDGADGDVDVDVGGAVQWVEQQHVFAFWIAVRDRVDRFHFFRCHRRQVAAPFIRFEQDFVGDDVQFFLDFTLDVFGFGGAKDFAQRALAYRVADGLAGAGDDFDQQAQLGRDRVVLALFFDQVLGKADAFHLFPCGDMN
jgi:hypothetical protein